MQRLAGKTAIITGGVSGMGLAAVRRFVEEGARVVIADIQDDKGAALEQDNASIRYVHCDIREEEGFKAAVALAVTAFGGLDIMYHNAGAVGDPAPLDEISVEGWDNTQHLLLRSTMLAIRHAIAPMRASGGGSIILTSSAAAVALGGSGPYAYTIAKAGVIAAGKYAALQLGEDKIRVNTIIPGAFATSIWSGHVGGDADMGDRMGLDLARFSRMQPIPQPGDTRNVADAALFFASDESTFVTGVAMAVDGGLTLFRNAEASQGGQLAAVHLGIEEMDR